MDHACWRTGATTPCLMEYGGKCPHAFSAFANIFAISYLLAYSRDSAFLNSVISYDLTNIYTHNDHLHCIAQINHNSSFANNKQSKENKSISQINKRKSKRISNSGNFRLKVKLLYITVILIISQSGNITFQICMIFHFKLRYVACFTSKCPQRLYFEQHSPDY